jgi:anti-anti-sigma regulatory factor
LTFRIQRLIEPHAIVFVLSGEMDGDHSTRLAELLDGERPNRVQLDLADVTLVDRAAVRFLARVDVAGIALINCPDYIRSWVAAETES